MATEVSGRQGHRRFGLGWATLRTPLQFLGLAYSRICILATSVALVSKGSPATWAALTLVAVPPLAVLVFAYFRPAALEALVVSKPRQRLTQLLREKKSHPKSKRERAASTANLPSLGAGNGAASVDLHQKRASAERRSSPITPGKGQKPRRSASTLQPNSRSAQRPAA